MTTDIFFRAFELSDAVFINDLRKLDEFENLIGGNKRFVSSARDQKWIESLIFDDCKDKMYVAICSKSTNLIAGYASLSAIDHINKACVWSGIKIHPDHHCKGYASQTTLLLMKFAFEELNMERISGQCLEEHAVSRRLFVKSGFKLEGIQRNSVFKNGTYHNECVFSVLKEEFADIKEEFEL